MNASTPSAPLLDALMQQLQGAPLQQLAQQLGTSSSQVESAVGPALSLLLDGLGRNAAQPEGASALLQAWQQGHASHGTAASASAAPQGALGALGGLGDLLGNVLAGAGAGASPRAGGASGMEAGAAILGQILGGQRQQAESQLGERSGLGAQAGQLLALLAPIVMQFLAQRAAAGQLDASSLGNALGQEPSRQPQPPSGVADSLLTGLLDQNRDGKLDAGDLLQLGAGLLRGRR
jgi:hypothetical protein